MRNAEGQVVSYDLLVAVFIFLLVFSVLMGAWLSNINAIAKEKTVYEMRSSASQIADLLILTAGIPSNWQAAGDANIYGLAISRRILSPQKLSAFGALDYNSVRQNMRIADYDFYIKIEQDLNRVYEAGSIKSNAEFAVNASRVVSYNGKNAMFYLVLYK